MVEQGNTAVMPFLAAYEPLSAISRRYVPCMVDGRHAESPLKAVPCIRNSNVSQPTARGSYGARVHGRGEHAGICRVLRRYRYAGRRQCGHEWIVGSNRSKIWRQHGYGFIGYVHVRSMEEPSLKPRRICCACSRIWRSYLFRRKMVCSVSSNGWFRSSHL